MKRCALLVGVNEYLVLNGLQYARQDAESFAEMLQRCCGFEEHEITLMTCRTTGGTRATARRSPPDQGQVRQAAATKTRRIR